MSSTSETNKSDPYSGRMVMTQFVYPEYRCSCNKLLVKNGLLKCDRCCNEQPLPIGGEHRQSCKFWGAVVVHSNEPETRHHKPRQTQFISSITTPYGTLVLPKQSDVTYGAMLLGSSNQYAISFPENASGLIRLESINGEWLLSTPFGDLHIPAAPMIDCRLTSEEGRLQFAYTERR